MLLVIYLAALHSHWNAATFSTSSSETSVNSSAPNGSTSHGTSQYRALPTRLKSVYIRPSHPFSQVTEFVESSASDYHLDLESSSLPMQAAFAQYLQQHAEVKAVFVGTRRTDPHGGSLTHFDMTDRGWPAFMRIHPVIDWHYREIWAVSTGRD